MKSDRAGGKEWQTTTIPSVQTRSKRCTIQTVLRFKWSEPETLATTVTNHLKNKNGQYIQSSVHFARLKKYHPRETSLESGFDGLSEMFLCKRIPLPELDWPDGILPRIMSYIVVSEEGNRTPSRSRTAKSAQL